MSGLTIAESSAAEKAASVLAWARALVQPALLRAVEALPDPERRIAGYHRGWYEADGTVRPRAVQAAGGKGVRPALALLAGRAVGGEAEQAVPGAVAVELVHDFSLLHDDVIDGDALRRHRPAAWAVHGVPAAVLTGDALLAGSLQTLARHCSPAAVGRAMSELSQTLEDLLRGQSLDVAFASGGATTAADYLEMADGKTGALMGCACALGAVLAGADEERAAGLREFGRRLGVAFQCADDVLGIWGAAERSGKPVGADVRARKKSLPVVVALADTGPSGRRLAAMYERPEPFGEDEVRLATGLIEAAGGRRAAELEAERQVGAALRALARAEPVPEVYRLLQDLAVLMTRRDS